MPQGCVLMQASSGRCTWSITFPSCSLSYRLLSALELSHISCSNDNQYRTFYYSNHWLSPTFVKLCAVDNLTLFLFRNLSPEPNWHFPLWFSSKDSARSLPPRENVCMPPACFHLWNSLLLDFVCFSLLLKELAESHSPPWLPHLPWPPGFPVWNFTCGPSNEHYNVSGRQKGMIFLEGHEFGDSDQFSLLFKTSISISALRGHSLQWCHKRSAKYNGWDKLFHSTWYLENISYILND